MQPLQDSLPGGVSYLVFHACEWPVKRSLLTKLGALLPLRIRGIQITNKLSKAELLSFCEGLSKGRGVFSEVWVYCDEYQGPDLRVGSTCF